MQRTDTIAIDYEYHNTNPPHTMAYLWPCVETIIAKRKINHLFELGCGNGAFALSLAGKGVRVVGVDPSEEGIAIANTTKTDGKSKPSLHLGSAYDDLAGRFGQFPCVVSLEVVEHVYYPRKFAKCVYELLQPGGIALISTPYHGYLKNLALSLAGKMDSHFTALWDHGHIKFWSKKTLQKLFGEQDLHLIEFYRLGRVPPLAKSMLLVLEKRL